MITRMSTKLNTSSKPRMTSDERRAAIVDAACRLFAEKGFRGTTTRELAAAVGVTEPVLYEHFRTKRDLYSAIIGEKAKEGIATLVRSSRSVPCVEDDVGFFNDLGKSSSSGTPKTRPSFVCCSISNLEGHELKDLFHERSHECFDRDRDLHRPSHPGRTPCAR